MINANFVPRREWKETPQKEKGFLLYALEIYYFIYFFETFLHFEISFDMIFKLFCKANFHSSSKDVYSCDKICKLLCCGKDSLLNYMPALCLSPGLSCPV